jgi:hypothetical protein
MTRGGQREGAGRKKSATSRRHVVGVRLNEDEHDWLVAQGSPVEVIRRLIKEERARKLTEWRRRKGLSS